MLCILYGCITLWFKSSGWDLFSKESWLFAAEHMKEYLLAGITVLLYSILNDSSSVNKIKRELIEKNEKHISKIYVALVEMDLEFIQEIADYFCGADIKLNMDNLRNNDIKNLFEFDIQTNHSDTLDNIKNKVLTKIENNLNKYADEIGADYSRENLIKLFREYFIVNFQNLDVRYKSELSKKV